MVPGFSRQHLCNRDLAKIRIPKILGHDPKNSRLPNPYLAEVRSQQRASQPIQDKRKIESHRGAGHGFVPEEPRGDASRPAQSPCRAPREARHILVLPAPKLTRIRGKPRPIGVPGTPLCWNHHPAPPRAPHNGATGLPRGARCGLLSRPRGRPPECHRPKPIRTRGNPPPIGVPGMALVPEEPRGDASRPAQSPCRAPREARHILVLPAPKLTRIRGKPRPIGVPGTPLCWNHHPAPPRAPHNGATGLPRGARCGLLSRPRGRPPARHRRGRSPLNQPTSDHADGATLGRRDAKASRRPRRPVLRAWSGTTAATGTGPVSLSVGDKPTRIGTPPSPAGRRRYKHRSALCSAHVSGAMEPTRIGTPPSPAGRRRYKHRSALCSAPVPWAMEPTRIGTPPSPAGRRRFYEHRCVKWLPDSFSRFLPFVR